MARPGNDFTWSSWHDQADAVEEIDGLLSELEARPVRTSEIAGLFAPTGPMHELARASGWGTAFGELADRFDDVRMVARERWSCTVCGNDAGTIELAETGALTRESFTSRLTERVADGARFLRIWDAIVGGDTPALFAVDTELAPWWCPECEQVYCGDHWERWDVFDDDGFHDCIRGRCLHGHERMLED